MKRLLLLVLIVAAGWHGWKHQNDLRRQGTHELVASNRSAHALERVRIAVAGGSFTIDSLAAGASMRLPLRAARDGVFSVSWNVRGVGGARHWTGGRFTNGPLLMRHRLEFTTGDGVVWMSERMTAEKSRAR